MPSDMLPRHAAYFSCRPTRDSHVWATLGPKGTGLIPLQTRNQLYIKALLDSMRTGGPGSRIWLPPTGLPKHRQLRYMGATAHTKNVAYSQQYAARRGGLLPTLPQSGEAPPAPVMRLSLFLAPLGALIAPSLMAPQYSLRLRSWRRPPPAVSGRRKST